MSDYEPLTPVDVEQRMSEALAAIETRINVAKSSRETAKTAKRDYTLALAAHRQGDKGSRDDRADRALIAHEELWRLLDTAEVAASHAQDLVDLSEKKLSALQTVAKLVLQAYNVGTR